MVFTISGEAEARSSELLASVHSELTALRKHFQTLKERVETGEEGNAKEAQAKVRELTAFIHNCQKAEANLESCRQEQSQIAQGGYALDLDAARDQVRCALGRLREHCGAGSLSGGT